MLNLNAGFKELHYMLCMSEARKINSAKKSIEGGCESMNQMQTTTKKQNQTRVTVAFVEIMSNQQVSGNQRDLHQNKQILGSFPLPHCLVGLQQQEAMRDLQT